MIDTNKEIKELKRKLIEHETCLNEIELGVKNLKKQNRQELANKEKELENWRQKLEIVQQERNLIKKQIREKVLELEKSDLENTEKQSKINKLLTEHSEELEEIDKLLYDERTQYRKIRDRIFEIVLKPCQICEEKDKHIKNLEERVKNLQIWGFLLLLASIFHFFLFLYVVFDKKKKKTRCCCVHFIQKKK